MPNPENLVDHVFKPGQSGNPAGRPKGAKSRSTVLKELYSYTMNGKDVSGKDGTFEVEYLVMAALIKKAMEGDVAAVRELQDTMYGKLTDKQEVDMVASVARIERVVVDKA